MDCTPLLHTDVCVLVNLPTSVGHDPFKLHHRGTCTLLWNVLQSKTSTQSLYLVSKGYNLISVTHDLCSTDGFVVPKRLVTMEQRSQWHGGAMSTV